MRDQYEQIFTLPTERTPLLKTCRESRALALERGIIGLSTDSNLQGGINDCNRRNFQSKEGDGTVFEAKMRGPRPGAIVDLRNDTIYLQTFHGLDPALPFQSDFSLSRLSIFVGRFSQD
jgi:hypothetical protein